MEPCIRVGIDVGCKAHRVGVAGPDGAILDEFDISHTREGFEDLFRRVGRYEQERKLPVAVAMEGWNGGIWGRITHFGADSERSAASAGQSVLRPGFPET